MATYLKVTVNVETTAMNVQALHGIGIWYFLGYFVIIYIFKVVGILFIDYMHAEAGLLMFSAISMYFTSLVSTLWLHKFWQSNIFIQTKLQWL